MHANFQLGLGRLDLAATLRAQRGGSTRRWLLAVAALLTFPLVLALVVNGLVQAHVLSTSLSGVLFGSAPANQTVGRALTFGPPLALLLLLVATLRVRFGATDGRWSARVEAVLTPWEMAVAVIALAVAVLFFGHLLADGLACARGDRPAC